MLWNKIDLMDLKILAEGRSDSKAVMELDFIGMAENRGWLKIGEI